MTITGTRGRRAQTLGSGWSDAVHPAIAAREAVESALADRGATAADVVVLFVDVSLDAVPAVEAAMAAAAPARLVACSGPAVFSSSSGLASCVATHIPGGEMRFGVGWADVTDQTLEDATRSAVLSARDEAAHHGHHAAVVLLSDILAGDAREVVRGAYDVAGATVPLVGGVVGCIDQPERSWLVAEGMILRKGVVALWIASSGPLGVAVDHGWQPIGRPMQVTRASDMVVHELDGQPADVAYREARALLDPGQLPRALHNGLELPVGIPSDTGGYEVRAFVVRTDDGFQLTGSVHEQAIVRLMSATTQDLLDGAARAGAEAAAQLVGPAQGALAFSCMARYDVLGPQVVHEIDAIGDRLGAGPVTGFFTYGEFAKVPGSLGFHAASVAVLAV